MKKILALFLLLIFLTSCKNDVEDVPSTGENVFLFENNDAVYASSIDGETTKLYDLPTGTLRMYSISNNGKLQVNIYKGFAEIRNITFIDTRTGSVKELELPYNISLDAYMPYVDFGSLSPDGLKTVIHHTDNLEWDMRDVSDVWIYDHRLGTWSKLDYNVSLMSPGIGGMRRSWSNDSRYFYFSNGWATLDLGILEPSDPLIYRYDFNTGEFSVFLYMKDVCPDYAYILNVIPSTYDDNMIYEFCVIDNYENTALLRYRLGSNRQTIAEASMADDDQLSGADYALAKLISPDNRYVLLLQEKYYLMDMQSNKKVPLPLDPHIDVNEKYVYISDVEMEGNPFSMDSKYLSYHEVEQNGQDIKDTLKVMYLDNFTSKEIVNRKETHVYEAGQGLKIIGWTTK